MRLFRSEEHVRRWSEETGTPVGAIFSVEALWVLARLWFRDRLEPGWRRRTPEEVRDIFDRAGLSGPFWSLSG